MLATEVPIDSIVREMKRGRNYTLGLGRATPLADEISNLWPSRVACSLHDKTHRSTLLVETQPADPLQPADGSESSHESMIDRDLKTVPWSISCDPAPSGPAWNRQSLKELGAFPKWKEQYPLIVLHLGQLDSIAFAMLGRLCDGIALAADMSRTQGTSLRQLSRSLRHHQAQGCRLLGMWSVEIG